jgi:4-hydroxy-tetrahydrodipicolinate synthase
MTNILKGLTTALITPFTKNKLDYASLEKILQYQMNGSIDRIILAGSTGEGTSLDMNEYEALIQASIDIISGKKMNIIVSCGSGNTREAINMALKCQNLGINTIMCCTPSYIKPTQAGLYQHFLQLHNISDLQIILYSVPSRTGIDFTDDTIIALSQLPRIIALKDSGVDLMRPMRLHKKVSDHFIFLDGNDNTSLAYHAQGGAGCISVASNIAPSLCKQLHEHLALNDYIAAFNIQQKLLPLYKALSLEQNPIGVKYAAYYLGLCTNELRLPLMESSDMSQINIKETILQLFKECN